MKRKVLSLFAVLLALGLFLAACGTGASSAPAQSTAKSAAQSTSLAPTPKSAPTAPAKKLVVGASPAPHAEILELIVPILKEQGIELEVKVFNDYILPNVAVSDGSLDANYFQHLPYLENYNEENGTELVNAGGIHIEPLGVYPGKLKSLDEIASGASVGIPNDPTNEARALALLNTLGLIELNEGAGLLATPKDIVNNPHNLKFTELEAAQLPVTLPDFDFAVINGNYAVEAGIGQTVLATEGAESPYVNVIAVQSGNEASPEIKALLTALQSEEVREFIKVRYGGIVVPVF